MSASRRFAFANILQVLDALPVGVLMVSPDGLVLHINQALSALTGFAPEEARGLPCRHILRAGSCVAGCALGCGSFGGVFGQPASQPDRQTTGRTTCRTTSQAAGRRTTGMSMAKPPLADFADASASILSSTIETDILTLKKRKVPVRLTHFPVPDANGKELFRLDVVEDSTELKRLEERLHQASGHGRLIGRSAAMERLGALIPSIAPSCAPVFITGETGTGKDVLAETLHQASHRSREPFVRLNVSPLPEDMLLPEIFGQAFPDGPERPGRFQQARGGTLYLPEIADIPKGVQTRLVQYLDTGTILPVGALREHSPDVRLITATNRNPAELVEQGALSDELYHRLNVVHLHLPPLRERKEDIDFLLKHFLDIYAARFKKSFTGFSPEAGALLVFYDFPGNVRELKNIVEYAAMVCANAEIGVPDLPALVTQTVVAAKSPPPAKKPRRREGRGN